MDDILKQTDRPDRNSGILRSVDIEVSKPNQFTFGTRTLRSYS